MTDDTDARALPAYLVYGPHGAGLTTSLQAFTELGYVTMAGVPLDTAATVLALDASVPKPLAIGLDVDPRAVSPEAAKQQLAELRAAKPDLKTFYLSTPTEVLIRRFSAAEKPHPLQGENASLREAIESEQLLYAALKPLADYHVDTSTTTGPELALKVAKVLGIDVAAQPMTITLTSFGFKHGIPTDADLVFDMRFVPNPFYQEHLRPMTGLDQPVKDYVFGFPEMGEFLEKWQALLVHTLPFYRLQGKTRVNIAIGCTGGQHRSVCMTMAISEILRKAFPDFEVRTVHRDQRHWPQPSPAAS